MEPMTTSTLSPEAIAIAQAQAEQDIATLARLVREKKVDRAHDEYAGKHPELARAVNSINRAVKPAINTAIRPKAKKRRRK